MTETQKELIQVKILLIINASHEIHLVQSRVKITLKIICLLI